MLQIGTCWTVQRERCDEAGCLLPTIISKEKVLYLLLMNVTKILACGLILDQIEHFQNWSKTTFHHIDHYHCCLSPL